MINELMAQGYNGWVFYLDADAFINDLDYDVWTLLSSELAIVAAGLPGNEWDINDGVFLLNLGSEAGREIASLWYEDFMSTPEEQLRLAREWDDVTGDQDRLHRILRENHHLVRAMRRVPRELLNHPQGTFVRQILHADAPSPVERMARIRRDVEAVIKRDRGPTGMGPTAVADRELATSKSRNQPIGANSTTAFPVATQRSAAPRADQHSGEMSVEDIITVAYKAVLGRGPDPGGLQAYKELVEGLSASASLERAVKSLVSSKEFQQTVIAPAAARAAGTANLPVSGAGPARSIQYFHSFDFGNGEVINGIKRLATLQSEAEAVFSEPIQNKMVLDIGAWDGYFSFEAEKRGASYVLATDHFSWSGPGWGTKAGFEYVHARLGSQVKSLDIDVFDLDPEMLGTFDVCLFLGVLYHLENPLGGLKQVFRMTHDLAVIETEVTELTNENAVLRFYEGRTLNNDATNFFVPNHACLEGMLREVGFRRFKFTPPEHPAEAVNARTIVHAWK